MWQWMIQLFSGFYLGKLKVEKSYEKHYFRFYYIFYWTQRIFIWSLYYISKCCKNHYFATFCLIVCLFTHFSKNYDQQQSVQTYQAYLTTEYFYCQCRSSKGVYPHNRWSDPEHALGYWWEVYDWYHPSWPLEAVDHPLDPKLSNTYICDNKQMCCV